MILVVAVALPAEVVIQVLVATVMVVSAAMFTAVVLMVTVSVVVLVAADIAVLLVTPLVVVVVVAVAVIVVVVVAVTVVVVVVIVIVVVTVVTSTIGRVMECLVTYRLRYDAETRRLLRKSRWLLEWMQDRRRVASALPVNLRRLPLQPHQQNRFDTH